jgi:hypothetical protein
MSNLLADLRALSSVDMRALGVNYTHVIPVSQPRDLEIKGSERVKIEGFCSFLQIDRLNNRTGQVVARLNESCRNGCAVKDKAVREICALRDSDIIANNAIVDANVGSDLYILAEGALSRNSR